MSRTVSPKGRRYIYTREGGVVRKAYRDAVGVWTVGPGLTAASGVVVPKAGMTIRQQLRYLADIGAVRNTEAGTVLIAEITRLGVDHVERRAILEGVKRPSPAV